MQQTSLAFKDSVAFGKSSLLRDLAHVQNSKVLPGSLAITQILFRLIFLYVLIIVVFALQEGRVLLCSFSFSLSPLCYTMSKTVARVDFPPLKW